MSESNLRMGYTAKILYKILVNFLPARVFRVQGLNTVHGHRESNDKMIFFSFQGPVLSQISGPNPRFENLIKEFHCILFNYPKRSIQCNYSLAQVYLDVTLLFSFILLGLAKDECFD